MKLEFMILLLLAATGDAHNVTRILASHPSLSTFNQYLTTTHLADEINRRDTITVCAVDNAAMAALLSHHFPLPTLTNILSLHIFADYFGSNKLHQITKGSTTTSSLFQATGEAAGTSGYVNITDLKGGKVGFTPVDADAADQPMATFVKSIYELPYNISVIQISSILTSPEAEAPAAAPSDFNLISLLARQGCKSFSDLLTAQRSAADAFAASVDSGLTVFCPSDGAVKSFAPSYKNLTAAGKASLLLYHGAPEYNSLGMLRSGGGLVSTLATEGKRKFDFTVRSDGDEVKVETEVVTATIKGTLIDRDPVAVYKIDRVLLPTELFKTAPAEAREEADAPGPAGDDDVTADENSSSGGWRVASGGGIVALSTFAVVFGVLLVY
ncbi:fasciclin-like arabinogalactan protein 2 [Salvia miltiorrhiza]|uniref:fasciclin-like arabinogalactan protein 2 n=1 Tax=Salvia miltiorrhiza TaxID=226208 RepID=UPI0025AD483E|nr:fasciclin-like arabinogalactan protein 2 [Salvia miltiorrhiza]